MVLSKGEELLSEGKTLTSSNHGFSFLSINISNPNNSKHEVLLPGHLLRLLTTWGSTLMRVFTMTSLTYANT
jgi:hypothetical protein